METEKGVPIYNNILPMLHLVQGIIRQLQVLENALKVLNRPCTAEGQDK